MNVDLDKRGLEIRLAKAVRLVELYEWIFENGCSICRDATVREDGQVWVVYDVDGDLIARGRDAEEAAWGAWDLSREPECG